MRGIRVFLNIDPALPPVLGGRVQLQQVMLNLLLNAFDAMASYRTSDSGGRDRDVTRRRKFGCVAVRDCCPGLAGDIVEKLFLPFVTSKRDGLGLGLSTSRSIVGMHGGRIWAENNPDGGATFYFTLPSEWFVRPLHRGERR